jgi:hypothetical protein
VRESIVWTVPIDSGAGSSARAAGDIRDRTTRATTIRGIRALRGILALSVVASSPKRAARGPSTRGVIQMMGTFSLRTSS